MKKLLGISFVLLLLLSFSLQAAEVRDQFQAVNTAYESICRIEAKAQSFRPTLNSLTRVRIPVRNNGPIAYPSGSYDRIQVQIVPDTPGAGAIAFGEFHVNELGSYSGWRWLDIPLGEVSLDTARTYYLVLSTYYYRCDIGQDYVQWAKSASDAYVRGNAYYQDSGWHTGSGDFVFETYGDNAMCEPTRTCYDDASLLYIDASCQERQEHCPSAQVCRDGLCYDDVNMHITSLDMMDLDGFHRTAYASGSEVRFFSVLVNNGDVDGTFDADFEIHKDGSLVTSVDSVAGRSIGEDGTIFSVFDWAKRFTLPGDWSGNYEFRVSTTPCRADSFCRESLFFAVNAAAPPLSCRDADGDGYYADCGGALDCDDADSSINPGAAERCDGMDNNCRESIDEPFEFYQDSNNCGVCGNACGEDQYCRDGVCSEIAPPEEPIPLRDDTIVLLHPELFSTIAEGLIERGEVNRVFFKDESEKDAEDILARIAGGLQQLNDLTAYPIMQADDFRWVVEQTTIITTTETEMLTVADVGDDVIFVYYQDTMVNVEEITTAVRETDDLVKKLKSASTWLSRGLSVYYGATHSEGDAGKWLIYTGSHHLYNNVLPHMVIISFAKGSADLIFGILSVDPDTLPFPFDFAYDVVDLLTDERIISNSLDGQCGLLNGKTITCAIDIADAFTHPLAWVDKISPVPQKGKMIFHLDTKNYWEELLGGRVFFGASIYQNDDALCHLPWQEVQYLPGEEKDLSFEWNMPEDVDKEREYRFITGIWYNADGSNCRQLNNGCYTSGCLQNRENYATFSLNFTIQNTPPIFNSLNCNGLYCGTTTEIEEGEELELTLVGSDIDGDELSFRYEFLGSAEHPDILGIVLRREDSCAGDSSWDPCSYTWTPAEGLAGTYSFRFSVCDGYGCDRRELTITVRDAGEQGIHGDAADIQTNIDSLQVLIGGSSDLTGAFSGIQEVKLVEGNDPLIIFSYDFTRNILNLEEIALYQQDDADTAGSLLVRGLTLPAGHTKTAYLDHLDPSADRVCIRDAETTSLAEMSHSCTQPGETVVPCTAQPVGGYTCTREGEKFKVAGLVHSAVKELGAGNAPEAATEEAMEENPGVAPESAAESDSSQGSRHRGGKRYFSTAVVQRPELPSATAAESATPSDDAVQESALPEDAEQERNAVTITVPMRLKGNPPAGDSSSITGAAVGISSERRSIASPRSLMLFSLLVIAPVLAAVFLRRHALTRPEKKKGGKGRKEK